LDVVLALAALAAFAPLMAAIAIGILITAGRPALFRQTRPGLRGAPFEVIKFRTMTNARDRRGELLPDSVRLAALGRWLRWASLDELPELLNVLRGEMSLVGPRPLLVEYLEKYDQRQGDRHLVRPGITGLAQVRGRNATTWERRLENDLEYVRRVSWPLDLGILAATARAVVKGDGGLRTSEELGKFPGQAREEARG
jgi:sugar transferase EpsL